MLTPHFKMSSSQKISSSLKTLTFAGDIKHQDKDHFMVSYDINSLFTNIPLDEVIDIWVNKLYPGEISKLMVLINLNLFP